MSVIDGDQASIKLDELRKALLDDATEAAKALAEGDTPYSRRAYVRSAFSFMEGITRMMKDAALLFDYLFNNPRTLTPEEVLMLMEKDVFVTDKGAISDRPAKIRLPANFQFAVSCYAKVFHLSFDLELKSTGWQKFKAAGKIRDKIVHPKSADDFNLSDSDVRLVKEAMSYFMSQTAPLTQISKRRAEESRQ